MLWAKLTDSAVGYPLHPALSPAILTMSCHWAQVNQDDRVRLTTAQLSLTIIQVSMQVTTLYLNIILKSCGIGQVVKVAGVDMLVAIVMNLHAGNSGHWVIL